MNAKTTISKGLGAVAIVGLVLGLSLVPTHSAQALLASVAITASPSTICAGQSALITWSSTDATSISIDQGIGSVAPYGAQYVAPTQTTTYMIVGANTTGGYGAATATVYVNSYCVTPTPTPYYPTLQCSPSFLNANSGDLAYFSATGGNGSYSWTTVDGSPLTGYGSNFSTRFYTYGSYSATHNVTVTSNGQTSICQVLVAPTIYYPTPTPYYPGTSQFTATLLGRNVSRGQTGEYASVTARGGDTITKILHIRSSNSQPSTNVFVTDVLPAGLSYVYGSTTLNNFQVADGITSSGINIGTIQPGQEKIVRFAVRVDPSIVPTTGSITIYDNAQVRSDAQSTVFLQLPITVSYVSNIGTVGGVQTGPADSLLLALVVALAATAMYAAYAQTNVFTRRAAMSEIATLSSKPMNFAR